MVTSTMKKIIEILEEKNGRIAVSTARKEEGMIGEFKFRIWNKKRKRWVGKGGISLKRLVLENIIFSDNFEDYVFLQYTGLHSKNGKEIYEGDIVKTPLGTGEIFVRLGCWYVEMQKALGYFNDWEVEVIGNIYKNPERR